MAEVVVMPQLGNTVESCLITAWRVAVGDRVEPDTVVADIETDKSAMDVPAGVSGTVLALLAGEGDEVPVKAPFLVVGLPGDDITDVISGTHEPTQPVASAESVDPQDTPAQPLPPTWNSGTEPVSSVLPASSRQVADSTTVVSPVSPQAPLSPRAQRIAAEAGIDTRGILGTGPHGRVSASDVQAAIAAEATVSARHALESGPAPAFTRGAGAIGAPAPTVGTGLGGRVTTADILSPDVKGEPEEILSPQAGASVAPSEPTRSTDTPVPVIAPSTSGDEFPGTYTQTQLKGIRKLVATRMLDSLARHAQLTFDASAPAEGLLALRAQCKNSDPALGMNGITIGDMVAFAAVKVACKHPSVNGTVEDQVLRTYDNVHLGLAVDTPRGLLVPTVRFASRMGLRQFSAATKELAAQSVSGNVNPDLLAGATFTVTNLGAFGIESFTPILNSPQTAILGVNTIVPRAMLNPDGAVGVEQRISFSLTVDHAVVDGADAARYLKDLADYIANIYLNVIY